MRAIRNSTVTGMKSAYSISMIGERTIPDLRDARSLRIMIENDRGIKIAKKHPGRRYQPAD
jgi:hypothetical protein